MSAGAATSAPPITSGTTPQPPSTPGSTAAGTNALASQQIAGNFQSFLTLLTTQLQNQNPLDPIDTNQFTQQLVEFAGVQQQLNTNDSLATLVSLQQATQSTQALDYVGKSVAVDGATAPLITVTNQAGTSVSQAVWELDVPADAAATITISAANGQTAFSEPFNITAGKNQPFVWNGLGSDGTTQWPAGNYTISVTAKDANNNTVAISTQVVATVDSVDLTQSPPLLSINGKTFAVSQINSVVN